MKKHLQTKHNIFFWLQVGDIKISDIFYKVQKLLRMPWAPIITTNGMNFLMAGPFRKIGHFLLWRLWVLFNIFHPAQCIRRHSPGHHHIESSELWEAVLHTPRPPFKSWDRKWKHWCSTKPTKLHLFYQGVTLASQDGSWKMWRRQWMRSLVLALEGKASLSLTWQGWHGHPSLLHQPRSTKYPPKTPSIP